MLSVVINGLIAAGAAAATTAFAVAVGAAVDTTEAASTPPACFNTSRRVSLSQIAFFTCSGRPVSGFACAYAKPAMPCRV